jgi:hypothetical protein
VSIYIQDFGIPANVARATLKFPMAVEGIFRDEYFRRKELYNRENRIRNIMGSISL